MRDILTKILEEERASVEQLKARVPLESFRDELPPPAASSFRKAITASDVNIIAELKKASPSRGVLTESFDPPSLARTYAAGGAAALSVLTEERYFQGHPRYLTQAKEATGLPVLCKDFIVDPYQLYYARRIGADAVLLIVRAHTRASLGEFIALAREIGLDALVEVHREEELEIALSAGADIIGVNNRDLSDFRVDLGISERLAGSIPDSVVKITESGIFTPADVARLWKAGYSAFLVGEALVKAADPAALIRELRGE